MLSLILLIFVLCLSLAYILADVRKPKGYPPGPIWLPLVGCYPYLKKLHLKKKYLHLAGSVLHEIYGPVVGLKLGFDKVVLVSGYKGFKEICGNEYFDGRPDGLFFRLRSFGERLGVVFVDGPFRHEQKKFTMNVLRKLGYGSHPMHDIIVREVQELVKIIESNCEEPFQINNLFDMHALNVIWTLLAGYRFSSDDKRLPKLLELVHKVFQTAEISGGVINQMPFLKYIAPDLSSYNILANFFDEMMSFLQDIVNKHNPADDQNFISIFSKKIRENDGMKDTPFTKKQLLVTLQDLFMAGTETTSNTLVFAAYHLIKNPQVQKKIHAELDREMGTDEIPTMEHRNRLIYLEATIMEVLRISSLVPLTLPHKALRTEKLMGYTIPKDTILLPSIWSVHMDEKYWKDPHEFCPDRFIDENGKIIQHSHFMPFGTGRRKCLGEVLAKTSLFIFLAVLLKKFELQSPVNDLSVEVIEGVTLTLAPFKIKFTPRHLPSEM